MFCSRFLQAADLSTSALAHREVWPKNLLGMFLRLPLGPRVLFAKKSNGVAWNQKKPGFDFQYNALGFILQKLQFSTFTLHLSSGKDIVINIEFGKKNIHLW